MASSAPLSRLTLRIATSESTKATPTTTTSSAPSRPAGGRKPPAKKVLAQSTILQPVDDAADPLGPLGASVSIPSPSPAPIDQAPTPPRKEPGARNVSGQSAQGKPVSQAAEDDTLSIRSRGPPAVQAPGPSGMRPNQPSMSVEQAAKPTFDILVGDPHKVGDFTSSHVVYQVRTKVRKMSRHTDNILTLLDFLKSLQATRIRCLKKIPRLPLAVQFITRQQSWCSNTSSTREAGRGQIRYRVRRISATSP